MFRPPVYHPHGGPPRQSNGPYPGHSLGISTSAPSFVSSAIPMHGRGAFHHTFHGGPPPYRGFSPAGTPPPPRSPPLASSPPVDAPAAPTLRDMNLRSVPMPAPPPPPAMPKDPEMLKNIEVLSTFVVKNGSNFEKLARAKQAGNPKFCFLFGGDPGTDAALGYDFYNWKKEHLLWVEERAKATTSDHQRGTGSTSQRGQHGLPGAAGGVLGSPGSPAGSDMDMEDDFATPEPADDRTSDRDGRAPGLSTAVETNRSFSSTSPHRRPGTLSPKREGKPDYSSSGVDKRPKSTLTASERGSELSRESEESNVKTPINVAVDGDCSTPGAIGLPAQNLDVRGLGGVGTGSKTPRVSVSSNTQRVNAVPDVPRRRDTRRRTGFDRPCMEDVISPQDWPKRSEQQTESSLGITSIPKVAPGAGIQDIPTRSSRWGPEPSSERLSSGPGQSDKMLDTTEAAAVRMGSKKSEPERGQMSPGKEKGPSPDAGAKLGRTRDDSHAKYDDSQKPKSGVHEPAVDEFGRLLREGGSDSDADDNYHSGRKRRRRSSSRSRSGSLSPSSFRFKHRSPARSPHRRGRRSRSRSHSPRWNKSHSDTPSREGKWGGEGRVDRGGRRGGRSYAGAPPLCFDFVKGKCFRGPTCRFLHEESQGAGGDHTGRRMGARGRDLGYGGREEGERNWSSKRGDDAKLSRSWASHEGNVEDNSRELTLIEELNSHDRKSPGNELPRQDNDNAENVDMSSEERQRTESYQPEQTTSNMSNAPFPASPAVPSSQLQSGILIRHGVQAGQPVTLAPDSSLSKQLPVISTSSTTSTQKLGSLMSPSSQQALMDSPTPRSQTQFPSVLGYQQQPAVSMAFQQQNPGHPRMPNVSQNRNFASGTVHQHFPFSSARSALSENLSLPSTTPPLAPFPMGQSQGSFNSPQHLNFASFPTHGGQNIVQFRLPVNSSPPQMIQTSLPQEMHPRPGLPWLAGGFGNPLSRPLGHPQLNQHLPPHGTTPLARPPLAPMCMAAPFMAPPSMAPPSMAPPSMAPPSMAPPSMAPPSMAPPSMAPPSMAPPSMPPPFMAPPSVAPPSMAPPSMGPSSMGPPSVTPLSIPPPSIAQPSIAPSSMGPPSMFSSPVCSSSVPPSSLALPLASLSPPPPSQPLSSQATIPRSPSQEMPAAPSMVNPYSLSTSRSIAAHRMVPPKTPTLQPSPRINDQYDPLADSFEPVPPGSVDRNGLIAINQVPSRQNSAKKSAAVEQWRQSVMRMSAPLMTDAGEVVLENVSPGMPTRMDNAGLGHGDFDSVSPTPQPHVVLENVSPTREDKPNGMHIPKVVGGLLHHSVFKTVSPLIQNHSRTGEDFSALVPATKEEKRKVKDGRVLNLIRKAVADHVKDVLKPTWKGGQMSKEAFKTICKKAVDKVMLALEAKGQIPKTQEKVDAFMQTSKPKIAKLVQGYVDKYVKV